MTDTLGYTFGGSGRKTSSLVPSSLTAALDKSFQSNNPKLELFIPSPNVSLPKGEVEFTQWLQKNIRNLTDFQRSFVYYDEVVFFLLILRLEALPGDLTLHSASRISAYFKGLEVSLETTVKPDDSDTEVGKNRVALCFDPSSSFVDEETITARMQVFEDRKFRWFFDQETAGKPPGQASVDMIAYFPFCVRIGTGSVTTMDGVWNLAARLKKRNWVGERDLNYFENSELKYVIGDENIKEMLSLTDEDSSLFIPIVTQTNKKSLSSAAALEKVVSVNLRVHHGILVSHDIKSMASDLALLSISVSNPHQRYGVRIKSINISIVDAKTNKQKSLDHHHHHHNHQQEHNHRRRSDLDQPENDDKNVPISDDCFRISKGEADFPILLKVFESYSFLFNIALIQDYLPKDFFSKSSHAYQILVFLDYAIVNLDSDASDNAKNERQQLMIDFGSCFETLLPVKELFVQQHESDISISFHVITDRIRVRQIFTIQVFIVNNSNQSLDLTLYIPIKDSSLTLQSVQPGSNAGGDFETSRGKFQSDAEFLKSYYETESNPVKLVCMESVVNVPLLEPKTCQSVHLHFVAVKEATHAIEGIRLLDKITGNVVEFERVVELYVHR